MIEIKESGGPGWTDALDWRLSSLFIYSNKHINASVHMSPPPLLLCTSFCLIFLYFVLNVSLVNETLISL